MVVVQAGILRFATGCEVELKGSSSGRNESDLEFSRRVHVFCRGVHQHRNRNRLISPRPQPEELHCRLHFRKPVRPGSKTLYFTRGSHCAGFCVRLWFGEVL